MTKMLVVVLLLAGLALGAAPVVDAGHESCDGTVDCTTSHVKCVTRELGGSIRACTGYHTPPPP